MSEDKEFNLKGLLLLLISITVFLGLIAYLVDFYF